MKKKAKCIDIIVYAVLILFGAAALFPVIFIAASSLMDESEVIRSYVSGEMDFHIIPRSFSVKGYLEVFLYTPSYLMKFWKSMLLSTVILAGQLVISCLGGYGFAKFSFKGKNVIFFFVIILMMMPLQVTLVPNYIVFELLGLIGSYASVILPGIFSTFGVFLLTQFFSSIPNSIIEAAKLDGANQIQILCRIIVPYAKSGVASLCILNFIDTWNMVEQPLIFLKDSTKYPLSVFLANVSRENLSISFVCGILAILPVFLLFLYLKDSLISGIENTNLK